MSELKTKYKFIEFNQSEKTGRWYCSNTRNGDFLGAVMFFTRWKEHTFAPAPNTEFSTGCLVDIADFLEQLNKKKKEQNNNG